MKLKKILKDKTKGHYKEISTILKTSEWGAEEVINGKGLISLDNLESLLIALGLDVIETNESKIIYEVSTEVNQKTFRYYASYWLQKKKYEVRESTYANYSNHFVNSIIPCLGDIPCENFNNNIIQSFAYWAKDNGGKEGKGISEHYIRDAITLIKSVIKDGQEQKVFPDFALKSIKIPKTFLIEENKTTYTEEDYKKIIEYSLKNLNYNTLGLLLGIYTGMRIGEICALQFKDIDLKNNTISVNKTLQRIFNPLDELEKTKIIITPCKTKNSIRKIPITNEIANIIKTLKTNDDDYVLSGKSKEVEPRTYRKRYNKIMKDIGVKPIKFHALRHTFASMNIENGVDVKTISEILGHSDVGVTLKIYTHTSQKAKLRAIEKFNNMFKDQQEKINFTSKYKGNICLINKRTKKCDFIGNIKEISKYLCEKSNYICNVINGIEENSSYDIIPKIIGITHDENDNYVGG